MIITKSLELEKYDYYKYHISLTNVLLNKDLSSKEIDVLAAFLSFEKKYIEEDMFNTYVRREVRKKMGLSPGGLGNHLKSLLLKKCIDKNEITEKITVKPYFIPTEFGQGYQIKLKLKNEL
jgi:DNA-binding MarR family transcriptional regulator